GFALVVLLSSAKLGVLPVQADVAPSRLEARLLGSALRASVARHAPKRDNPVTTSEENLIAARRERVYRSGTRLTAGVHRGFSAAMSVEESTQTRSRPRRYVGICATGDVDTDPGAGRQFTPLLIFATNIDPKELVDDAFLRRIGYRSYVTPPRREMYAEIFKNYVESTGFLSETGLIDFVLRCYEHEQRPLRGCE